MRGLSATRVDLGSLFDPYLTRSTADADLATSPTQPPLTSAGVATD
jgi:hypothetical protein